MKFKTQLIWTVMCIETKQVENNKEFATISEFQTSAQFYAKKQTCFNTHSKMYI